MDEETAVEPTVEAPPETPEPAEPTPEPDAPAGPNSGTNPPPPTGERDCYTT